ncbi:MAG: hypothetical protein ACXVCP_18840 [Bdellovibrio sp.]
MERKPDLEIIRRYLQWWARIHSYGNSDQIKTDLASAPYLISMKWNQVEVIDLPRKQQRAK